MVDDLNTEVDSEDTGASIDTGSELTTDRSSDFERSRDHDRERDKSSRRERPSVRDTIRQSFDDVRQDDDRSPRDRDEDRDTGSEPTSESRDRQVQPKKVEAAAPISWTKEAKASWNDLPDRIKQEVVKRENDVQKGVESLKKQYSDIDEAIAPYTQVIKQFQKTPAQAVSQLFAWFDALARDPDKAFPALLQSYKYDPGRLLQAYGVDPRDLQQFIQYRNQVQQQNAQQAQNGQIQNGQAQEEISPAVRQYIDGLHNELSELKQQVGFHFNGLAETFAQQNAAKTQEMLDRWAVDKPYFNEVRVMMGHLLTPDPQTGQAAVPLKDGKVDLDTAYEMAIYALPDIRQRLWEDQQAQQEADRKAREQAAYKAQQEKANQARKAANSLRTTSPGSQVGRQAAPSKGLSVRDSLKEAIASLSDGRL